MKHALLGVALLLVGAPASAQVFPWVKRTFNYIFNDTTAAEEAKFIAYPTLAYAPETKWEIGLSALYVYYANKDTTNRLSEINAFTFFTLESQYGLWVDHALYSDKSNWFFLGRLRYQRFPLLYYGVGPNTPAVEQAQVDANSIAIRERVLHKVVGDFYMGAEFDVQRLGNVSFEAAEGGELLNLPLGNQGSTNLGIGVGLVYDQRHNVLNVREGIFGETGFLRYSDAWGSDYQFTSYFLDLRYYHSLPKNQVLAYQVFGSHADGSVPFNMLSLMGGESLMRGYYLGRYRDKTLAATQVEYRFLPFPFSKRWGAAAFVGAGTVAGAPAEISFSNLKLAGGGGLRFMIFPKKDVFTRLDVAFTEEGSGIYFYIGEAF